jgi:hypothetical protein
MHRSSQPARARERPARRGLPSWLGARPGLALAAAAGALALALIVLVPGGGGHGTRLIRAEVHAPHAYASVKLSGGHAVLNITGLPQTPAQRVYEVWIKRSGEPQPTDALFTVTSRGDATVGVPGSISGVKLIMVTSEPLGGSLKPTSSPVIVAKLA